MPIEKSEALILRVIPFRDTSKVVTAYAAEQGLVSLLAKGVRAAKPRYGAALELFAVTDLVWYQKASRELQLLSSAALLEANLRVSADPVRYFHGAGVLEFLLKTLSGQEPPGKLYPLSLRTLEVLGRARPEAIPAVFRTFELKAVSFLGHRPELHRCVECGEMPRAGFPAFSPLTGGVVCGTCRGHVSDAIAVPPRTLETLRRMMAATLDEIAEAPPPASTLSAVAALLERFLQAHLERYEALRALRMAAALPGGPVTAGR